MQTDDELNGNIFLEDTLPFRSSSKMLERWGFPGGSVVKNLPVPIHGSGRSLGKEMETHSSILAWEIPWTKEPGKL